MDQNTLQDFWFCRESKIHVYPLRINNNQAKYFCFTGSFEPEFMISWWLSRLRYLLGQ